MKRILFLIDWFDPAYKAGGPIRSIANLAKLVQHDYDVHVITGNRELGEKASLGGVPVNEWIRYADAIHVFYSSSSDLSFAFIKRKIKEVNPDFVYSSGIYSRVFTIYPLIIKRFYNRPFKHIIGTHGMLKPTALSFKPIKKSVYFFACKLLNLFDDVTFHVTDDNERADVLCKLGNVEITEIADASVVSTVHFKTNSKSSTELKIIYVGRIHPIKNLKFLISLLFDINKKVFLTIIGPIEDESYWNDCLRLIARLPSNISVTTLGSVPPSVVLRKIAEHHLFCLPTLGENFGHSIYEALSVGRPVLISDRTPWVNLKAIEAGWDISLEQRNEFISAINNMVDMEQDKYDQLCANAFRYSQECVDQLLIKTKYLKLFS